MTSRARTDLAHGVAGPDRYKVQFTASEEYVRLVDEAKALLSHSVPNAPLEDLHLRAMRTFVAQLKKRKYATTKPPNAGAAPNATPAPAVDATPPQERSVAEPSVSTPRPRGRHISAAVRRAVATRDAERCSYVDDAGRRCTETHCLEFHHVRPFARGGAHTPSNLTLRCRAHNALAAEHDFGDASMDRSRPTHEPFRGQTI